MKLTCTCLKQFDDQELLTLHVQARHSGPQSDEIVRGKQGGRKSAVVPARSSRWRAPNYPRTGSLRKIADAFRPAAKPVLESEPVVLGEPTGAPCVVGREKP